MKSNLSIEEQLRNNTRAIDAVSDRVEMIDKRLDVQDDILLRLGLIEETLHVNRDHATDVKKDLQADIKKVEISVEDKVQEIKDVVAGSEHIMVKKGYFDKIKNLLKRKAVK